MARTVQNTDTFETWRLTTNAISQDVDSTSSNLTVKINSDIANVNNNATNLSIEVDILQAGIFGNTTISANNAVFGNVCQSTTFVGNYINVSGNISSPLITTTTVSPYSDSELVATTAFVHDVLPRGVILMWSGSIATIPTGWALCDGANSTPDLRSRFIVGAGSTYAVAATGGSANAVVVTHTHPFSATTGVAGQHFHNTGIATELNPFGQNSARYGYGSAWAGVRHSYSNNTGYDTLTDTETAHDHSVSGTTSAPAGSVSGANANLPPYYALAYIMKVTG